MKEKLGGYAGGRIFRALATVIVLLLFTSSSWAQKKQKKPDNSDQPLPALPVAPSDQIDHDIGEMLGAFQVGDVEAMHKYYSDQVTFVNGNFEPPIVGWQNYAAAYQRQKAAFPGMQLIRRNTYIFTHGDVAWATYQWEFASSLNGKPVNARGQTTLVFNRVGDRWLIVHNHTSQVCDTASAEQAPQPAQTPRVSAPSNQQ